MILPRWGRARESLGAVSRACRVPGLNQERERETRHEGALVSPGASVSIETPRRADRWSASSSDSFRGYLWDPWYLEENWEFFQERG